MNWGVIVFEFLVFMLGLVFGVVWYHRMFDSNENLGAWALVDAIAEVVVLVAFLAWLYNLVGLRG